MTLLSSAMTRRLSNWQRLFLNSCGFSTQRAMPQQCVLCAATDIEEALCAECYAHLPWLDAVRCPQCALPTPNASLCGACLAEQPRYDSVSAAFAYAWPLAPLIHHYKYAGNL